MVDSVLEFVSLRSFQMSENATTKIINFSVAQKFGNVPNRKRMSQHILFMTVKSINSKPWLFEYGKKPASREIFCCILWADRIYKLSKIRR